MRRLFCLGLIFSAGAVAGCSDTTPNGQSSFVSTGGTGGGGAPGTGSAGRGGAGSPAGGSGGAAANSDAGVDGPSAAGAGGGAVAGSLGTGGSGGGATGGSGGGATGGSGGGATGGSGGGATGGSGGGATGGSGGGATGGSGGKGATGGSGGSNGAAGAPQLAPPTATGLVALNSDFSTTSLSILSTQGGLLHADCVDSATGSSGSSSKTISGDATLPSQPQPGGDVVIIDRGNGALTFVDPGQCKIIRQIGIPGGAKTDPHDVVILSDSKAYVTRYTQNLAATDPTLAGNDVIVINPTSGALTKRIVVDAYASVVPGATILARPDRALIGAGKIVVSLNEIDASYGNYGEGKVIVIDPATDQVVASVALTGLYDCEGMAYVAATKTLLVSCGGTYGAEDQPLQSGIAVVDLGASPPKLSRSISSVAFDDRPLNFAWVIALPPTAGGTRAFAGTSDPNFVTPDALFAFDYVVGTATQFATSDPYTFGRAAGEPGLLLVPDSNFSTPQIKLYDVGGTPQATTSFASDPVTGLPPQEVVAY